MYDITSYAVQWVGSPPYAVQWAGSPTPTYNASSSPAHTEQLSSPVDIEHYNTTKPPG